MQTQVINLGSGQRKFGEGWLNVDISPKHNPDVVMDSFTYLATRVDRCIDMIVLHQVLEHYGCGEADSLLRECFRTLKVGGQLLVFVPDMWKLAHMWIEGQLSDQLYFTNVYGAYQGEPGDRHYWGMTKASLTKLLKSFGFKVCDFDWRDIPGADIARDDRWILGVQAVKP